MNRKLAVESLAGRLLLDASFTAEIVDRTLHVVGIEEVDFQAVRLVARDTHLRVAEGNNANPMLFDASLVDKVLVELGDGDDRLDIRADGAEFNVDIEIIDADGEDRVLGADIVVNGDVVYRKIGAGSGFTTFDGSTMRDVTFAVENPELGARIDTGFSRGSTIRGDVVVHGGTGQAAFSLLESDLLGSLDIFSAGGQVRVEIRGSDLLKKVTIVGRGADDWILIQESHFHRKVTMRLAKGDDTVLVSGNSIFDKKVTIAFGGDDDEFRTFDQFWRGSGSAGPGCAAAT
jgi:hypothetical protein